MMNKAPQGTLHVLSALSKRGWDALELTRGGCIRVMRSIMAMGGDFTFLCVWIMFVR